MHACAHASTHKRDHKENQSAYTDMVMLRHHSHAPDRMCHAHTALQGRSRTERLRVHSRPTSPSRRFDRSRWRCPLVSNGPCWILMTRLRLAQSLPASCNDGQASTACAVTLDTVHVLHTQSDVNVGCLHPRLSLSLSLSLSRRPDLFRSLHRLSTLPTNSC